MIFILLSFFDWKEWILFAITLDAIEKKKEKREEKKITGQTV